MAIPPELSTPMGSAGDENRFSNSISVVSRSNPSFDVGNATAIATNIVINWAMIVDRILGMSGIF